MHQIMVEDSRKELTIEEQVEYEAGWMTWGKIKKWRFWLRREWWYIYILAATSVTLAILLVVFHHPVRFKCSFFSAVQQSDWNETDAESLCRRLSTG